MKQEKGCIWGMYLETAREISRGKSQAAAIMAAVAIEKFYSAASVFGSDTDHIFSRL